MTYKGPSFVNSTQNRANTYLCNVAFEEISIVVTFNFKLLFCRLDQKQNLQSEKMTLVFPHFEDKSLDRWMMVPKSGSSQVQPGGASQDLAEALQRFHIASASKSQVAR